MRKLLEDEKNTRLLFCRKPATRAKQNVRICAKIAVKKRSFVVDKKKKLKRTMKSPEMAHSLTPPVLVFKPIFRAVFFFVALGHPMKRAPLIGHLFYRQNHQHELAVILEILCAPTRSN